MTTINVKIDPVAEAEACIDAGGPPCPTSGTS